MCAARSVYGWDLIVTKKDGVLVMDKRREGSFDLLTVSETAQDPITDDKENINGVHKLSEESTACNFDYAQQVLTEESKTLATTRILSAPGTPTPPRLDTATASGTWAAGSCSYRGTSSTA